MSSDQDQQNLFLKWCAECGQKCCRNFGSYLTDREANSLALTRGTRNFMVGLQSFGQPLNFLKIKNDHCVFLSQDGRCGIQDQKPMICKAYPIKYFRDGHRLRWFVTMFCPAAESFIETSLRETYPEVKKEIKSWPVDWVQNLTSLGLLVELGNESGDAIREKLLNSDSRVSKRNHIFDGQNKSYRHNGIGLEIALDNRNQLWVDLEHKSYLQARLIFDSFSQPINILATQLAVSAGIDRIVTESIEWGKQLFKGFRVISTHSGTLGVYGFSAAEHQYSENQTHVHGIRYFLIKDNFLINFACEVKGSRNWKNVKREVDETIKKFKFSANR